MPSYTADTSNFITTESTASTSPVPTTSTYTTTDTILIHEEVYVPMQPQEVRYELREVDSIFVDTRVEIERDELYSMLFSNNKNKLLSLLTPEEMREFRRLIDAELAKYKVNLEDVGNE